jgi:hypothetical protein
MTNALAARVFRIRRDEEVPQLGDCRLSSGTPATRMQVWNARQMKTFQRYVSLYQRPLTPDMISMLARRYAEKHVNTRPRLLQQATTR